ncbi:hypothetical protein FBR02_04370 [Anaerolineae bacterium CFX9]|nr:hypothetical protein [Anaerolineae bacterium CFX9]
MTERANSILAVDFGNVNTRAVLIDLVEGVYTLVTNASEPTTAGFPSGDVGVGLLRLLRQLSEKTGRMLATVDGRVIQPEQPDRSGVDTFVTTASIGRPLRTVLVGLVPEMSIASGMRAAAGTYVNIVDTISLADTRSPNDQLNALILARPDLIFMVGGTEKGARTPMLELIATVRLALRLMPRGLKPMLLYAGNSALEDEIQSLFGPQAHLMLAQNVRPSLEDEALESAQLQLALAFDSFAEARGVGFDLVGSMSAVGILPNAQSYNLIADYLGKASPGKNFMIADVGSAVSTMSAHVSGSTATTIRTDIGIGHSARATLEQVGTNAVRHWLPFSATDNEILAYALNKTLRPASIPEGLRALYLEHALLRAALRHLLMISRPAWTPTQALDDLREPLPAFSRIIAAGAGITQTGRPGMSAMLLLDALEPVGVTQLEIDPNALISALGALARVNSEAVVQLLDASGLESLGTCISLSGQPRGSRTAARVQIRLPDGTREKYTIPGGSLWVYPLGLGVHAEIRVSAGRGMHIDGRRSLRLSVEGGTAGVIIDARGRPLPLSENLKTRAEQISGWYAQATGDLVREIDSEWLLNEAIEESLTGQRTPEPYVREVPQEPRRRRRRDEADAPKRERRGRGSAKPAEEVPAERPQSGDDLDDLRTLFP